MNALAQSNNQALAIFAHEMREPLASILFAAQWLVGTECDAITTREMCEIVERQSRYLALMIDDLLEVSRGQDSMRCLRRDWFDLGTVITSAVETTNSQLAKRGHRLTILMPPSCVRVMADAMRVQQVVVNLLANAAKYTEPGGAIQLFVGAMPDQIVIEVRDNGIGIAPEFLPHVFDLFAQGGEPRDGKFSGLGIGLALVKSLVELHGGKVSAHSDGLGAGSTFVVRLPCTNPVVSRGHIAQGSTADYLPSQRPTTGSMTDA